MSLIIGRIENKFWSNRDHKVPNSFPVYAEEKELKDANPNMSDFMSGTIYLYGDQWNHCKYKGAYYALYILQVLDEDKKYYCYRLERELWFDVLKAQPRVVGDLINSNNDELLEKHLNRTIGVLDNPAHIVTVNFGEINFDWRRSFTYKLATKHFEQVVLSKRALENFFSVLNEEYTKNWKKINKFFYDGFRNPSVFIFSFIAPSIKNDGWKNLLVSKINDFITSLDTDEGKNYKISKVTRAEGSKLQGNYCITSKQDGIGTTEEEIRLTNIDLSNLIDIVPVTFHTPDIEREPFVPMNEGEKGGVFELVESQDIIYPFLAKIRRKAYLPIGAPEDRRPEDRGFGFSSPEFNWNNVRSPQKVTWNWGDKSGLGFLWYVENLNFSVDYDPSGAAEIIHSGGGVGGTSHSWTPLNYEDRNLFFFPLGKPWGSSFMSFKHLEGPLFNFGFLLLGIHKEPKDWKLFQYIGDSVLKKVPFISGINRNFLIESREEGFWWSDLKPELAAIQPSEEFAKFYLKNYFFSWLAFFPGTVGGIWGHEPGFWKDIWGTWAYTNWKYGKKGAMQEDLYDKNGKWKQGNPLHPARSKTDYLPYLNDLSNTLDSVLIKSSFDLPGDLKIEKGDYFFTDQDYDITEYFVNRRNYNHLTTLYDKLHNAWWFEKAQTAAMFSIEDFVNPAGSKPFNIPLDQKLILLCGTFEGNLEVRGLTSFATTVSLSEQQEQIVTEVDGTKSKTITCTLLKKLTDDLIINETSLLNEAEIKEQIIYSFYTAHGYKTKRIGSVAHWNWFNESDFAPSSDQQFLFDLKGTDWYCFIAKGKISLIAKNNGSFLSTSGKTEALLHSENKNLNIDLIQKINQKVRFQFFNAPYKLSWKTSFTDKDKLFLSYESLSPTDLKTNDFEQYFIKLETGFDQIWYENVSIPKERQEALSIADSVAIEALGLERARIQYAYQVESDRLALAERRYEENITRAQNNLDIQKYASWVKFGLSLSSAGLGVGTAAKFGGTPERTNVFTTTRSSYRKARSKKQIQSAGEGALNVGLSDGTQATYLPFVVTNTRQSTIPGKSRMPFVVPSAVSNVANAVADIALSHALYFPEQQRQINVEKQLGATELAIQSLAVDTSFLDRQISQQLALNRAFNVYENPLISEREILEKFLNKTEWHEGKKLAYAHLVVFIPSPEQMVALRSFKEEYGVMCDIPDITTSFYEGMAPDVIRYRNLDDEAITGIANQIVRDFLKVRLLAGIKIVKTSKRILPAWTPRAFWSKIAQLSQALATKDRLLKHQTVELNDLKGKIDTIAASVKKECVDEKNKLQKEIEDNKNELNNTKTLLQQKETQITQIQEEFLKNKKELEEKLKKECEDEIKKAQDAKEKEHDDTRTLLEEKTKEITKLQEQFQQEKEKLLQESEKELKVTKEQMEEEHNKKLTDYLIQRDKDLAAAKQSGFNSRNEEVRQLQEELEKCQNNEELNTLREKFDKFKANQKKYCETFKKYMKDTYEINLQERGDGGNALRDLVLEIIQEVNWMRRARLDTSLGSKYSQLRPLLTELMKLEAIPLVAKWEDVVDHPCYPEYRKFIASGGNHNGGVDEIIKKVNEIKLMDLENVAAAHGLKTVLDELNWLAYKAKNDLKEPLKNDQDLQYFFRHIYPGGSLEKYKVLFGDPNIAVTKKRFFNEMQCFDSSEELPYTDLEVLANFERTTALSIDEISRQNNRREDWDNFVPSFKGKPLSTKKEDIAVYMAPKYTKNAVSYLTDFKIVDNKYYWSGKFKSSYFSSIRVTDNTKKIVGSLHLRVMKPNIWTNIMSNRNFLWQNRGRIKRDSSNWDERREIILLLFGVDDRAININASNLDSNTSMIFDNKIRLKRIFGEKYWEEAAILLGIMVTNALVNFQKLPPQIAESQIFVTGVWNDNYPSFYIDNETYRQRRASGKPFWTVLSSVTTNIMAAHKNLPELMNFIIRSSGQFIALVLEFGDGWNLLSYIYRHVKLKLPRLEDPFGPDYSDTSKINFCELLKTIYDKNT